MKSLMKRNICVAVAGILLGAHFSIAMADESAIPLAGWQLREQNEPTPMSTYKSEHADSVGAPMGNVIPLSGAALRESNEPIPMSTYKSEHADSAQKQAYAGQ